MGLFDYIVAECPRCKKDMHGQTKAGDCLLNTYEVAEEMEAHEAHIVDGETLQCDCGAGWVVQVGEAQKVKVKLVPVEDCEDRWEDV